MKIQLDFAYTVDLPDHSMTPISGIEFAAQLASRHRLTSTVIDENGPAGGNPLIELSGNLDDLKSMIREYDCENGDFDFFVNRITE